MILRPVLIPVPQTVTPRTPAHVETQRQAARQALRICAGLSGAPQDGWEKDDRGVPAPQGGFHWSVAHKRAWAAAVISQKPVGIDIEPIPSERSDGSYNQIAGEEEWRQIGGKSPDAFAKMWTAKEAVLKATGIGISGLDDSRLVNLLDHFRAKLEFAGRVWTVQYFIHRDHVAGVTCDNQTVEWQVIEHASVLVGA